MFLFKNSFNIVIIGIKIITKMHDILIIPIADILHEHVITR